MSIVLKRIGLLALLALTLLSFAPVLGLVLAGTLAETLGCALDEGSAHPCMAAGVDIGGALNTAEILGWLMFVTWPGMLLCLGIWAWIVLRWLQRRRKCTALQ